MREFTLECLRGKNQTSPMTRSYPDRRWVYRRGRRREGGTPDAGLAALVAAWPTLPEPIKAAVRALVGTHLGTV
jgi:hypothetical protein